MRQTISQLTQSRFYSPAFNAAIFDGPLRIYFAQYQEALALKIYFRLQDRLREFTNESKPFSRTRGINIFVMLYPTDEIFENCFTPEQVNQKVVLERLNDDYVLGVCGPLREDQFDHLFDHLDNITGSWTPVAPSPLSALEA